jgi:hypothetical protein
VAAHAVFVHPETVKQTNGSPVFQGIRNPALRRQIKEVGGRSLMMDDNALPAYAFIWSSGFALGADVQLNHIWDGSKNPDIYTALWNLCVTPAFLARTTDGNGHSDVLDVLRYRSYDLYGFYPAFAEPPQRPHGYEDLIWPNFPPAVHDLEAVLRQRLRRAPSGAPARACRSIGWVFSEGPDPAVHVEPRAQDSAGDVAPPGLRAGLNCDAG